MKRPYWKLTFILLSLVLCFNSLFAQSRYSDSLTRILKQTTDIKQRVNTLIELSSEYIGNNRDTSLYFSRLALSEAIKNKLTEEELHARIWIGTALNNSSQLAEAKLQYDTVIHKAEAMHNLKYKAMAIAGMAWATNMRGNTDEALKQFLKALTIFESINDREYTAKTMVSIGMVYQLMGQPEKAENYLNLALKINRQLKKPNVRTDLRAIHTLANLKGMAGKYDEAIALDSTGLELCRASGNDYYLTSFYDNIANCMMYSGRYVEAENYFKKCIAIDSSLGSKKQISDTYLNLGVLFSMQKKYPQAIEHLQHSLMLSKEVSYREGEANAYTTLSNVYHQKGDNANAYHYLTLASVLKDSLLNNRMIDRIAEMDVAYQTERKEQQLILQDAELRNKNYLITGIVTISALSLIILLGFYRRQQIRNKVKMQSEKMEQQQAATRAVIEAEETERRRIAAELHDGIGQMMSAARMNVSVIESDINFKDDTQRASFETMVNLIDESCKELRAVSHQMMPLAVQSHGLKGALQNFINRIDPQIINTTLYTEHLEEKVNTDIESLIYRIIQECVNNAIKHANATRMDISVIRDHDGISATIEDNGKGFDVSKSVDGIGIRNIKTRVSYLKGSIDIDSSQGKGTLVAIHVPL